MRLISIGLALLCACSIISAQVVTITPAAPHLGDRLSILYDESASGAKLAGKGPVTGEALLLAGEGLPTLAPFDLAKSGSAWSGGVVLPNKGVQAVLLRFLAGEAVDDNGGNCWYTMVYGADGKPLEGANLVIGSFLAYGWQEFKHERDFAAAGAALAEERRLYPGNWRGYVQGWSLSLRQNREEGNGKVKAEFDKYYERFRGNEEAVAATLPFLEQAGMKERAEQIRKAALATNPKGPIAEVAVTQGFFMERDPLKRAASIEKYLADFPKGGMMKDQMLSLLANSYVMAGQAEKALAILDSMSAPDPMLLNNIAWDWVRKGENLPHAEATARKGIGLLRNPASGSKPSYMSERSWKKQAEGSLGMILDTYGAALMKQGKWKEAEGPLAEAAALTKGEDAEITERLLETLVKNGKSAEAVKAGKEAVVSGKTTPKLLEHLKGAYVTSTGSERGFEEMLTGARKAGTSTLKEKLAKERTAKPAVPWSLKEMNGKTISLGDLKGKVVVLDFWATWCGPCRQAFPTLQKVYDLYKPNPNVRILALDTWERVSGKEREDLVKKFIAENKYTFPVVYDEGFVEKYGVEGIPTKFVIDKKGMIAFTSIGFNGAEEMYNELTMQIDLLLSE